MKQQNPRAKWASIGLLAAATTMALSTWFSATAVMPRLAVEFAVPENWAGFASSMVSFGFVAGTLAIALLGVADRFDPRRLFMTSCCLAAAANLAMLAVPPHSAGFLVLRFLVGMATAGIYPVAMKMAAAWAQKDRGTLIGLLTGAVTLGSAMPHLLGAAAALDWRVAVMASSAMAAVAGGAVLFVQLGPGHRLASQFKARYVLRAWHYKPLRLANFGYFGHMWELYAMWSWLGVFLSASFAENPGGPAVAVLAMATTFAAIAAGAFGCWMGGVVADKVGRTAFTCMAMGVSGSCAICIGFLFGATPWLICLLALVWGASVIADSGQFSASVTELSDPDLVGTMLTVQTSIGFLITVITIHLTPLVADAVGWRYGFAYLALGPAIGIAVMLRLRAHPDAVRLANGNR